MDPAEPPAPASPAAPAALSRPVDAHSYRTDIEGILRGHPDLLFLLSRDAVIQGYLGGRDAELYAPPEQFVGRAIADVLPEPAATLLTEAARAAADTGREFVVDYALPMPGGRRGYEARLVRMAPDAVLGICRNITERYLMEERLRASERRLAEAERVGGVGTWEWDASNGRLFWSAGNYRILWRAEDQFDGSLERFLEWVHPDDAPAVREFAGRVFAGGGPMEHECRVLRSDGESRHVLLTASADFDATGRVAAVFGTTVDVTERKRDLQRTAQALSLLQSTLEAATDGIVVIDLQGRISAFNARFVEIWGLARGDVESGEIGRLLSRVLEQVVDPAGFLTRIQEIEAGPGGDTFDVIELRDGRTFERYSRPQRIEGTVVGRAISFRDMTERRRAEAAALENEARFRRLVEAIDHVAWLTDAERTRFLYVSPTFTSIWGIPVDGLYADASLFCQSILHDDEVRVHAAYIDWIASDSQAPLTVTYRITRPDGSTRWILDSMAPIRDEQGRIIRIGGIARDVTEMRRAEEARRHLEAQLAHAQRLEAIGGLATGVAHEFNNALAVIVGNAELARRQGAADPTTLEQCTEAIAGASVRAQALVRQILAFGRQGETVFEVTGVGPLVEQVADRWRLPGAAVAITVRHGVEPPTVLADAEQIREAIGHLVDNALDAVGSGVGEVEITVGRFDASAADVQAEPDLVVGPYACITVRDSGPGFDATTRARLFEPFFTTKMVVGGRGMGLSVVHGIVRRHGGAIRVWSEPGAGSRFDIYLPGRDLPVSV